MTFNVYAVIGHAPISKQNPKPRDRSKADDLALRLERGKLKAKRVLVTEATDGAST